ncbi:hypothetical protein GCM10010129_82000 [Streptomyces fumigatiscleroticus]|nr:hypothetical protein GCM10010129_82000 [Streptomyces fumigatiscleroticus]
MRSGAVAAVPVWARAAEEAGATHDIALIGTVPHGPVWPSGERDIGTCRSVRRGAAPPGCDNPAVPVGTREVPLLFGGMAQASFGRPARAGRGIHTSGRRRGPPSSVRPSTAHTRRGRTRTATACPRLVALACSAPGGEELGRAHVHDCYRPTPG